MKDTRETLIRKLLSELPELLADYEHLAPDADGKNRHDEKATHPQNRRTAVQDQDVFKLNELRVPW
jgi:hypothetical protein